MHTYRIPFNRPTTVSSELVYLQQAVDGGHLSGDGPFSHRCHALLEQTLDVPTVLLTTSCTHALEMAALLLEIVPGDEVIVPAFTFVSTVNAFVLRGARPVFADIRPDTLNLDESQLEQHITPRTKAIIVVHYGGIGCEMDVILDVARRHDIAVVEDNAQGLFGRYRDRYLGTLGKLGAVSFHETKNFTCGEGGALIINDSSLVDRAEIIREKGTDRSKFARGEVDEYGWLDLGSSYLPSDLLAAVLYAQLETKESIQSQRRRIWRRYVDRLSDWAAVNGVTLPTVPPECQQAYHLFYLVLPSRDARSMLIAALRDRGILAVTHYVPLHLSRMGRRLGGRPGACPVTESASSRLVRLPFYTGLTEAEQTEVVDTIRRTSMASDLTDVCM